ncbi:MAG: metallophosphoesterase, partial [Terracidiphilus sp.]
LQNSCHARGMDPSYALLASSLEAMRADAAHIQFIAMGGDLIAHSFSCKFKTLFPGSTPSDYRAFVEKTIEYVMHSLRAAFPGVPVFAALGNNDSDCGDYRLDAHSEFLAAAGKTMAADLPAREQKEALDTFAAGGYYSATLPAPFRHARLLVLDDLFMARRYATCAGKPDAAAAAAQIAWLEQQLERARRDGEKIWVMSHIPPGVDPYSTAMKGSDICAGKQPQMYLASETLADTLGGFGDVVQLAIFAHTHMDELRLLAPAKTAEAHGAVAVKVIPSISPIDGNNSSFMVARVDPASAVLTGYRVFAASNQSGVGTKWAEEYDYAKTYGEPSFSSDSVAELIAGFKADPSAQSKPSQSYLRNYFVGDRSAELAPFWPQYVCALGNHTEDAYRACVCPIGP